MKIQSILEAGTPSYNFDGNIPKEDVNRRALIERIRELGAGTALDAMLANKRMMIFRGIRGVTNAIFTQNTWESERRAQNTSNWVNLLSEVLPSWKRAGVPPRSKVVACTSVYNKSAGYGTVFVALPTDDAIVTYTRTHDFWDAFEALNHIYGNDDGHGAIPAINDGLSEFAERHVYPKATSSQQVVQMLHQLKADLDDGTLTVEQLNPELRALFESEPGNHDLFAILNNLMDPSHMKVVKGGQLIQPTNTGGWGEEIAIGGKIVYVEADLFYEHINRWD